MRLVFWELPKPHKANRVVAARLLSQTRHGCRRGRMAGRIEGTGVEVPMCMGTGNGYRMPLG